MSLPRWDLSVVFPSIESEEFNLALKKLVENIQDLNETYDRLDVRGGESLDLTDEVVSAFEDVTNKGNGLGEDVRTIGSFVGGIVSQNSRDDAAQSKYSELHIQTIPLQKLSKRYNAWIARLDVDKLIEKSDVAKAHEFAVRKAARAAEHLMSEIEEDLYSELSITGSSAWGKLHNSVSSRLLVEVEGKGKIPMSTVRGLAFDADEATRKAAYEAELSAWSSVEVPMAAAMNGIKGEGNTVNARRGWEDSIAPSLFGNNIDRQTLEAMQQACVESFGDFRSYFKAKAKSLGKAELPWWDLFAPVGDPQTFKKWEWDECVEFVAEQFGGFSGRLSGMAKRAFEERWVDAEPREGKADGAFCMGIRKDESRVSMNYSYSFRSVQTLAHEFGHAYHNVNLADRTAMQRQTPMALAETASIFCETMMTQAGIKAAAEAEKISILESALENASQVVVDIHSRFLFEKGVFEARRTKELSADEFSEMMLDAQRQTYGDGLDNQNLHKYMWAVKPHYYGATYYNWPYTFGLLFGTGLYAQYQKDPEAFKAGYDDLLSATGMEDAASLTARFGFDIRTVEFWRSSLDLIRSQIDEFVALVDRT